MYQDPIEYVSGAWQTSNPIWGATRTASKAGRNEDAGLGDLWEARLQALDEMLAALDPEDFIGRNLIMDEKSQIQARIAKTKSYVDQNIGAMNEQILSGQAQEAERQWGKELASLNATVSTPSQEWGGMFDVSPAPRQGQYGAITGRTALIGSKAGEPSSTYNPAVFGQPSWMRDIMTEQGLRPLMGNYALTPFQQQQVALQQTWNEYGKPKNIEEWLQVKPNVEVVMEQWRQARERVRPQRARSTSGWLAAAAR